jgi:hypothetical protein
MMHVPVTMVVVVPLFVIMVVMLMMFVQRHVVTMPRDGRLRDRQLYWNYSADRLASFWRRFRFNARPDVRQ